jgi:hypothetical protein
VAGQSGVVAEQCVLYDWLARADRIEEDLEVRLHRVVMRAADEQLFS